MAEINNELDETQEMKGLENAELSDDELANVDGGVLKPGSQVRISTQTSSYWSNYFKAGNKVIYKNQYWNVSWFNYANGTFTDFDLYNPMTTAIANFVPASQVIMSVV